MGRVEEYSPWGGWRSTAHGEGGGVQPMGRVEEYSPWGGWRSTAHGEGGGVQPIGRVEEYSTLIQTVWGSE